MSVKLNSPAEQLDDRFWVDPNRGGMRVRLGTLPCTFRSDEPHPIATVEGRRVARFRRHLEGGIKYHQARGETIYYVVVAMRYDQLTGRLKGSLRYSTQRFVQLLRRKGIALEYLRVVEPNGRGIKNHANLILATKGDLLEKHELKDLWATSTYGTSFELESSRVKDVGQLARYLSKFLGSYLSKTMEESFPAASGASGGLDRSYQTATGKRVTEYVTTSRAWLPVGAEAEWVSLFKANAFFWVCTRGFYHTNLGETGSKWLTWLDRQAWGSR